MLTFYSSLKNHFIKVEMDISRKEILINTLNISTHSPSELALMLKHIVFELKNKDIEFVIQQVTKSDWETILKPLNIFTYINENTKYDYISIKCPIDKFPEAVMKGLGFRDFDEDNYF
jgi:hypothetical protein